MDLRDQLLSVLGPSYTLERELQGGMSRVFVADDTALGRKVVVKVLAPELAGSVNVERFRREVSVDARLQHPHIVPLLAAGEVQGLPFFTMPYIDGESLRARLLRGELPVAEATALLRDIAKALDYAHAKGVVHRDIKPDNVLITAGSAMVTDFGVAKALSSSTAGAATLTSIGVALGTPAYMAPEQASADPTADHRADIYAFGVIAYEMLAGRPPFVARTAQQLMAAHATESPAPLERIRPAVPPAIAAIVMRCLEKRPADRPQDAHELVKAFEGAGAISGVHVPAAYRRRRLVVVGLLLLLVVVVASAVASLRPFGKQRLNPRRVMVAPFENLTGDSAFALVGRMASDFISQGVPELDSIDAVASADVRAFLPNGAESGKPLRELAEQLRAGTMISGTFFRRADSLRFQVQVVDVGTGHVARSIELSGPANDPLVGIQLVRDRLLGALALRDQSTATLIGAPRYQAYEEFLRGMERFNHLDYRGAISRLERAVVLDPTFGLAYGALATSFSNTGRWAEAESIVTIAQRLRDRFSKPDRALLDWTVANIAQDRATTFRIAQEQAARDSGFVWPYLTGVGGVAINRPRDAINALQTIKKEPQGWSPYFAVFATAYHQLGDYDAELRVAERGNARYPGRLLFQTLRALAGRGDVRRINAIVDSVVRVSTDTVNTPGDLMLGVARELRAHGHDEGATALLTRARAWLAGRTSVEVRLRRSRRTLGGVLFAMSRFDSAQTVYAALAAEDTTDVAARGRVATAAAARGDRERAKAIDDDLSRLRFRFTAAAEASYWRAAIAAALGDRESAVRQLDQALTNGFRFNDVVHRQEEFLPLRGYGPFEARVRPKS